ncbi:MAG: hypothetical protein HQK53_04630 [Oligoflexia bacterium]|nr:hypothetical protein [Oligoflexia bacterium]
MVKKILLITSMFAIFIVFAAVGCSGYRFRTIDNPFGQYGIKSITIPMFQNRSSIPNVSGYFTRELINSLLRYPGLKVYSGEWHKTDAVLLGIITSAPYVRQAMGSGAGREIQVGNRKKFYVSGGAGISLTVTLTLIKDPSHKDLEYFLSTFSKYSFKHPSVILSQSIPVSATYSNATAAGTESDGTGVLNFTNNKGQENYVIQNMAKTAADNFREIVLYAF